MLLRFDEYLETKIAAAEADIMRFSSESEWRLQELAKFYKDRYEGVRNSFHLRHNRDLVNAFKALQDRGLIQILAGAATHAYLPLLSTDTSIYSQLKLGYDVYSRSFGRPPQGIWLPECGYRPPTESSSVDGVLADLGYSCFVVDAHAIEGGSPIDVYSDRVMRKPQARAAAANEITPPICHIWFPALILPFSDGINAPLCRYGLQNGVTRVTAITGSFTGVTRFPVLATGR